MKGILSTFNRPLRGQNVIEEARARKDFANHTHALPWLLKLGRICL